MASEEMGLVQTQRIDNSLNPQLLFQDENPLRFGCSAPHGRGVGDPDRKTRELGGFMDDKLFAVDHRDRYFSPEVRRGGGVYGEGPASEERGPPEGRNWNGSGPASSPSSGEEEEDEEEEDDDEGDGDGDGDDEGDGEVEGFIGIDSGGKDSHGSGGGGGGGGGGSSASGDKIGAGNSKNLVCFGSSTRQMLMKDGRLLQPCADMNRVSSSGNGQQGRVGNFQKMVTIADHHGDMYCSQLLQGTEGSSQGHKDITGDNGCGISGRKEVSVSSDHGESLRAIFSDPITGALMDDAMILPCGHSFGHGGIQEVIKMKACYSCSHPVSEDSVAPNLSLRAAVQAFLREEDVLYRASKRRRERFEQEKGNYGDSSFSDTPRGRGVQFPFAVTDRVIIKGNKRTPERFVGREAIVTTQCLNGWYVVKTLDNAESVKLQYRSLEKVPDNPSSKPMPDKMTPNWL